MRAISHFQILGLGCLLGALTVSAPAQEQDAKPETLAERVSYSYGLMVARQLSEQGVEVDVEQFAAGFETALDGGEPALSEEEVAAAFEENRKSMDEGQATGADKKNLEAGQEFLEENARKEEVTTTESGLQYEVLQEGDGPSPDADDEVTVHYHGKLLDGTVFDSSVERGEPATFPLDRVIPGWTEGVQLMSEGAKYRFFIPHDLAYGSRGAGEDIEPYSTLVFDVELLEVGGGQTARTRAILERRRVEAAFEEAEKAGTEDAWEQFLAQLIRRYDGYSVSFYIVTEPF